MKVLINNAWLVGCVRENVVVLRRCLDDIPLVLKSEKEMRWLSNQPY